MVLKKSENNLFDLIGSRSTLDKVHKIFYDKIYAHPWISLYFKEVKQEIIESQQSDFMSQAMGGPAIYCGKLPVPAHHHLFISEELFELRTRLLQEAMHEAGINLEHQVLWLKIDQAFKKAIIKKTIADCLPRFKTDEIIDYPRPTKNEV